MHKSEEANSSSHLVLKKLEQLMALSSWKKKNNQKFLQKNTCCSSKQLHQNPPLTRKPNIDLPDLCDFPSVASGKKKKKKKKQTLRKKSVLLLLNNNTNNPNTHTKPQNIPNAAKRDTYEDKHIQKIVPVDLHPNQRQNLNAAKPPRPLKFKSAH